MITSLNIRTVHHLIWPIDILKLLLFRAKLTTYDRRNPTTCTSSLHWRERDVSHLEAVIITALTEDRRH